jgi:hypothetical protein
MARFTVRVELHYADVDDYQRLHAAMERAGFTRTIAGTDGVKYWLPTAEYNVDGGDVSSTLTLAERVATLIGKKFAVLVTESQGRRWCGLKEF